jgi:hypothetical protein
MKEKIFKIQKDTLKAMLESMKRQDRIRGILERQSTDLGIWGQWRNQSRRKDSTGEYSSFENPQAAEVIISKHKEQESSSDLFNIYVERRRNG